MHGNVGVRAHNRAKMTMEGLHAADGLFGCLIPVERRILFVSLFLYANQRGWQEIDQALTDTHRARTRAAAAVRNSKCFMQVEVHYIEAQIARAHDAQQSVQIGSVSIHQTAALVHQLDHINDVLIEQAKCVGICQHHANNRIVTGRFECGQINVAIRI